MDRPAGFTTRMQALGARFLGIAAALSQITCCLARSKARASSIATTGLRKHHVKDLGTTQTCKICASTDSEQQPTTANSS